MELMEKFFLRYLNAEWEGNEWFYTVWGSVTTVPLFKNEDRDTLRPVGIKASLVRGLHSRVVQGNRQHLDDYLRPEQLALSSAGGFVLVHGVRMNVEEMKGKQGMVLVKLDWRNAHNENSRAGVVEALESEASLQHLALHAATCLAGHQGLEAKGKL